MINKVKYLLICFLVFSTLFIYTGVTVNTYTFSEEVITHCHYHCRGGEIIDIISIDCHNAIWGLCTPSQCPSLLEVCGCPC